jgi:peptide/nickel transport system permease protein
MNTMALHPASEQPMVSLSTTSLWQQLAQRFSRHRLASLACWILLLLMLGSILLPSIFPEAVTHQNLSRSLEPPSSSHLLGTDELGRDLLLRIAAGGRVSLLIAFLSMVVAVSFGTLVGAVAGYCSGRVDQVLMRLTDLALSFPSLLLLILVAQILGTSWGAIVIAIGSLRWMTTARVVRATFLTEKELEYVEAARAVGARTSRIMLHHILPNTIGPLIVTATLGVGGAIVTESTLSYLGLGVQPPTPTWGNLLRGAQDQLFVAPWLALFPGAIIFLIVLSINTIGDALRDATAPTRN